MGQDIVTRQSIAYGNTLGTVAGAASDNFAGCTMVRNSAGNYTVLFNQEPPGLTTPKNVMIQVQVLAVDGAVANLLVTKTTDAAGNCTGFTAVETTLADVAWSFTADRFVQAA